MHTARKVFRRSIAWLSGLAVYASPRGLPHRDARLASSCWSDTTGRAFHPQGSYERFPSCFLTSHPPFPSLAWRNHIDLVHNDLSDIAAGVLKMMTPVVLAGNGSLTQF